MTKQKKIDRRLIMVAVIIVIAVLVNMRISRDNVKSPAPKIETQEAVRSEIPVVVEKAAKQTPQASSLTVSRTNITIISRLPKERTKDKKDRELTLDKKQKSTTRASTRSSSSFGQDTDQAEAPAPGITYTKKLPTKEEIEEMNAKGIIIW